MEGSDQEDRDLDEITAQIVTIGARKLDNLKENKDTEPQNIFDSPQKQVNEAKVFVQPVFFGPLTEHESQISEESVALVPTAKSSAFDITQSIIEEINKQPEYKAVIKAEFVSEENVLSSKSSKADADGDTQVSEEVIEVEKVNISVTAETSTKRVDKESVRQKQPLPHPPPIQKPHWKKRLQKFLTLGVARKLEVGYPPGYPIPKLPKSYFRKKSAQQNRNAEPQPKLAQRTLRDSLDGQVNNNKKDFESKFVRNAKGDIIMLNNIKISTTSNCVITKTNDMRIK